MHLECRALNHSTDIAMTTVVGNFAMLWIVKSRTWFHSAFEQLFMSPFQRSFFTKPYQLTWNSNYFSHTKSSAMWSIYSNNDNNNNVNSSVIFNYRVHAGRISSSYPIALHLKGFLSDADFLHCLHLVWDTDRPRQSVKDVLFSSGLALLVLSLCRCKLNRLMPPPALNIQHGRPLLCIGFTNCNKKERQPFWVRAKQTNILSD